MEPNPRDHGACHEAAFQQKEHGFQGVEARSVVEPVKIGCVLPTIVKFSVHIDPEPLEIGQWPLANRLELVHGAPNRNGPQTLHEGIETTTTTPMELTSSMHTLAWRSLSPTLFGAVLASL